MRVLIADDHGIVRSGIRLLLERQADIEVIGEAADGADPDLAPTAQLDCLDLGGADADLGLRCIGPAGLGRAALAHGSIRPRRIA